MNRPNIVFVLVDDLGWTDLSGFGSSSYETPNLDRLAPQGMPFGDAYAACPVCSATRASALTGQYAARVGITDWIAGNTLVVFTSDNGGLSTAEGSPTCNLPLSRGKGWGYENGTPARSVRAGAHKLIEFFEDGRAELYDVRADPGEVRDLAADRPEVAAELRANLAAWRAWIEAKNA